MTRIEDRLAAAAEDLRNQVAADTEVDAALAAVTPAPRRRRPYLLGAAAALVLAVLAGAALFAAGRDDDQVVADGEPSESTSSTGELRSDGEVDFEVLLDDTTGVPPGTLTYAGSSEGLADQWRLALMSGSPPTVDFGRRIVLSFTRTDCGESLDALDLDGDRLRARFDASACDAALAAPRTIALSVDRSSLPAVVRFVVPFVGEGPTGGSTERELRVDLASSSAVAYPQVEDGTGSGNPAPPEVPDLAPAAIGREITFDGVGDVRLGNRLDPSEVESFEGSDCGHWGPAEPTHDGDEPPGGLVDGATTSSPLVTSIVVRNPSYRTASGVGLGTSLATLQAVYGEDLVVDRSDGWDHPTDGLLASYQDVAAIRYGEHALTFSLRDDVVEAVKLSSADFWGDDEGCA